MCLILVASVLTGLLLLYVWQLCLLYNTVPMGNQEPVLKDMASLKVLKAAMNSRNTAKNLRRA